MYSGCVNKAIFWRNSEFPDKEKYMKLIYSASNSKSFVAKKMRKVYFQIILSVLKSSGYNKEYESLSGCNEFNNYWFSKFGFWFIKSSR